MDDRLDDRQPVPTVTLVLPVLDEREALPDVLARVPTGWRVIVADNGSVDGSPDVARRLGATVITADPRGYGAAVAAGIAHAATEIVAVMDADGSVRADEVAGLVGMLTDQVRLVCARRVASDSAWPWHARAGNALIAFLLRRTTGLAIHDLAPVRVARRADLAELAIVDRRFGYPLELLLAAARADWPVIERPIVYRPRIGRSKITGSVRGTIRVLIDFGRVIARRGVGRRRVASSSVGAQA